MIDQPMLPDEIEKAIRYSVRQVLAPVFTHVGRRELDEGVKFTRVALAEPIARLLAAEREKVLEKAAEQFDADTAYLGLTIKDAIRALLGGK